MIMLELKNKLRKKIICRDIHQKYLIKKNIFLIYVYFKSKFALFPIWSTVNCGFGRAFLLKTNVHYVANTIDTGVFNRDDRKLRGNLQRIARCYHSPHLYSNCGNKWHATASFSLRVGKRRAFLLRKIGTPWVSRKRRAVQWHVNLQLSLIGLFSEATTRRCAAITRRLSFTEYILVSLNACLSNVDWGLIVRFVLLIFHKKVYCLALTILKSKVIISSKSISAPNEIILIYN